MKNIKKTMYRCFILCVIINAFFNLNTFSEELLPTPLPPSPTPCFDEDIIWDGGVEIVPPDKTIYTEGETLDLTGLEAYGTSGIIYKNGTTVITRKSPLENIVVDLENKPLTLDDNYVTVSGWYSGLQMIISGNFEITVNPAPPPSTPPEQQNLLQLVDSSGNIVTELASKATVHAEAIYNTTKAEKISIYMALYDKDGALKNIKLRTQDTNKDAATTLATGNITLPESIDGASIKLFLWNDDLNALHSTIKII